MAEHTPGPWKVEMPFRLGQVPAVYVVACERGCRGGHLIAGHVYAGSHPYRDTFDQRQKEEAANAQLIAAAPELLEALEAVREWLMENGQIEDDGITHPLFVKANNLTNAAIARAKGAAAS